MLKFLLDANLSWQSRDYLISLGYTAYTVKDFNLSLADDIEIAKFAKAKKLIIITLDLDFGQIFYFNSLGTMGIIILKLNSQTVESVNKNLKKMIDAKVFEMPKLQKSLVIVDEKKIRIKTK